MRFSSTSSKTISTTQQRQHNIVIEVCVDSVESAMAAQDGGAARVELCANLSEGGITPSAGMIASVRKHIAIGLHVIIRPRAGDFCYSNAEYEVMHNDIKLAKQLGADGIVLGILNEDRSIDQKRMHKLIDTARPLNVTFHRAFDVTADPFQSLDDLIGLGADRILTSGQKQTAIVGLERIAQLVERTRQRIIIMAGGGIDKHNIKEIVTRGGVREVHVGSAVRTGGPSHLAGKDFAFGICAATDAQKVKQLSEAMR